MCTINVELVTRKSVNHTEILLTDHEAAMLLANEFANNFNLACNQTSNFVSSPPLSDSANLRSLNCYEEIFASALNQCSNLNSSPDGISFKLIKAVAKYIVF